MKKAVFFLITLFCLFAPAKGYAEAPRIDGVAVRWSPGPLAVSFNVKDAFSKEIVEAIGSGVPTSFTFRIVLVRTNSLWFDEAVGAWEFKHTVKYHTLRDEYEIWTDEAGPGSTRTKDFNEMKRIMVTGDSIAVTPAHLVRGDGYEVRIKAELHTLEMPPPFNYVFFFMKLLDFESDWYVYSFSP